MSARFVGIVVASCIAGVFASHVGMEQPEAILVGGMTYLSLMLMITNRWKNW
jgi:hypothetical protein